MTDAHFFVENLGLFLRWGNFAAALAVWKVGRVNECAGLEIRYTLYAYRGFESLTFRHNRSESLNRGARSFVGMSAVFRVPLPKVG